MEDVVTELPPPSRFYLDDLNNFASPPPPLPPPLLLFSNPNPNPSPDLLIVAFSPPSLALLHHLSPKSLAGTIILPEIPLSPAPIRPSPRHRSAHIYSLSPSTLLLPIHYSVPTSRSHSLALHLLRGLRPLRLLVLSSLQPPNFRSRLSPDDPLVFKLETSLQRSQTPLLNGLPYFPSGSVVDGLAAALLARSQIMNIKGTLCVTWPDSGNSAVSLLKSLLKDVLPDCDFSFSVESDLIKDARFDSELYT